MLDSDNLISRRTLLSMGGATATTLVLPGLATAKRRQRRKRLVSPLRRSSYHRLVGQWFHVNGSPGKMELIAVNDLNAHQKGSENAFALVFSAPRSAAGLHSPVPELSHPTLGRFPLLLTVGQTTSRAQHYVAIINRLHA